MRRMWEFCSRKSMSGENIVRVFLGMNIVIWCIIGGIAWSVIRLVALKDVAWLVTVIGYAGFFPGFVGGMLYVMNKTYIDRNAGDSLMEV